MSEAEREELLRRLIAEREPDVAVLRAERRQRRADRRRFE